MREGQASVVMDGFSQGWSRARERSWSPTLPLPGEPEEVSGKPLSHFCTNSVENMVLEGETLQSDLATGF